MVKVLAWLSGVLRVLYPTRASASKAGRQAYPTAHPLVCPPSHGSIGLRSSGCGQILSYYCRGTSVVVCCSDVCSCMCGRN